MRGDVTGGVQTVPGLPVQVRTSFLRCRDRLASRMLGLNEKGDHARLTKW